MEPIIFLIELVDNKYVAHAMGRAILIEANSWDELKSQAKKSILEFFKDKNYPQSILLHLTLEETINV